MWNFIRLENEHLNNCGQFRIVRDISIAPVEMKVVFEEIYINHPRICFFQDQEEILTLMDNPDGALIVRRRRKEFDKNKIKITSRCDEKCQKTITKT